MKLNKTKLLTIIILIMMNITLLYSFENQFFSDDSKYDIFYSQVSLYSITNNPALFKISFNKNIQKYTLAGSNKNNLSHREYSPEQEQNYNLEIISSKALNDNSTIASIISYNHDIMYGMNRSLEKNFYNHYFSFTDQTIGDTKFAGPHLQFIYNQSLNEKLFLGVKGNYGVEQGLKDVYTQCETIMRNFDVSFGAGLQSANKKTIISGFVRYADRQGKYEAVKEYKDALVQLYFGYNVPGKLYSRSSVHKTDNQKGVNYSLQLFRKMNNLSVILNGNYGYTINDIDVGSTSRPTNIAYWQREGGKYSSDFIYNISGGKSSFRLGYVYQKTDDWAKNPTYNVVSITNEETINKFNVGLYLIPNMLMKFTINGFVESVNEKYNEFIAPFEYISKHENFGTNLYFQIYLLESLSWDIQGGYKKFKPHFTWGIDRFNEFNIGTGVERYFRFGYVKISGMYKKYSPSNNDKDINEYQISLSLRK